MQGVVAVLLIIVPLAQAREARGFAGLLLGLP